MSRQSARVAAGQQTEALAEPFGDLAGGEHLYACGGELEREWNTINATADISNIRGVIIGQRKGWIRRERTIDE